MAKQRQSVQKRLREQKKREREQKKLAKSCARISTKEQRRNLVGGPETRNDRGEASTEERA